MDPSEEVRNAARKEHAKVRLETEARIFCDEVKDALEDLQALVQDFEDNPAVGGLPLLVIGSLQVHDLANKGAKAVRRLKEHIYDD